MEKKDVKEVLRLYNLQMEGKKVYWKMSKASMEHWTLPRKDVVQTYVIEDPDNKGKLCDFVSFHYFSQKVLDMKEKGHNYEYNTDANLLYYAF
jgi:L-amino acid N-acyltransferase YncA